MSNVDEILIDDLYKIIDICSRVRIEFRPLTSNALNEFLMGLLADKAINQTSYTDLVKKIDSDWFVLANDLTVGHFPEEDIKKPLLANAHHLLDLVVEVVIFESKIDELDEDSDSVESLNIEAEIGAFVHQIDRDLADGNLKEIHYEFLLNWIENITLMF